MIRLAQYGREVGREGKRKIVVGTLSFGEQKLVALARILATGARVLLLDEPASGIDAAWAERMLDVIEADGGPNSRCALWNTSCRWSSGSLIT